MTAARPISEPPPVYPGQLLAGKYRVERILGKGGMGVVVVAEHEALGERVAVKLLRPSSCKSQVSIIRFMREASAAFRLRSEHVVRVLDVGKLDDGAPYIAMEFLRGRDLSRELQLRGAFPVEEAVEYVLQVCVALAEAHSLGIVHRDLKPENLFLTERADGSPLIKLLDFGIAKMASDSRVDAPNVTSSVGFLGSPAYVSPEQARHAHRVDQRADIWALGVILHELLTGRVPFDGEAVADILAAIMTQDPRPLRLERPDAPRAVETTIATCLRRSADERYQSVMELALALGPFAPPRGRQYVDRAVAISEAVLPEAELYSALSVEPVPRRREAGAPSSRASIEEAETEPPPPLADKSDGSSFSLGRTTDTETTSAGSYDVPRERIAVLPQIPRTRRGLRPAMLGVIAVSVLGGGVLAMGARIGRGAVEPLSAVEPSALTPSVTGHTPGPVTPSPSEPHSHGPAPSGRDPSAAIPVFRSRDSARGGSRPRMDGSSNVAEGRAAAERSDEPPVPHGARAGDKASGVVPRRRDYGF